MRNLKFRLRQAHQNCRYNIKLIVKRVHKKENLSLLSLINWGEMALNLNLVLKLTRLTNPVFYKDRDRQVSVGILLLIFQIRKRKKLISLMKLATESN